MSRGWRHSADTRERAVLRATPAGTPASVSPLLETQRHNGKHSRVLRGPAPSGAVRPARRGCLGVSQTLCNIGMCSPFDAALCRITSASDTPCTVRFRRSSLRRVWDLSRGAPPLCVPHSSRTGTCRMLVWGWCLGRCYAPTVSALLPPWIGGNPASGPLVRSALRTGHSAPPRSCLTH